MITAACVTFCRWRSSAFDTTDAYLQNVQRIPSDESAAIQPAGHPNTVVRWSHHHRPAIYFEYAYTVHGREYVEYWFGEDEDTEPLPGTVKMHYHRKKPSIAYREGASRQGVVSAWLLLVFGLLLLVISLLSLLGF